eukprot:TRINITY_DN3281_c0_g1_i1.p1 TRINITY_DN3281_c0_g1~~TRINITY_DN3281_c0_g1_i1.p1  ORF type:complete len:660 (-),score=184.35 TRINITY_DN3281_c0_g1_i1:19-1998(-)
MENKSQQYYDITKNLYQVDDDSKINIDTFLGNKNNNLKIVESQNFISCAGELKKHNIDETEFNETWKLNIAVHGGKYYYEVRLVELTESDVIVGWDNLQNPPQSSVADCIGTEKTSYGYQVDVGVLVHGGLLLPKVSEPAGVDDIIGCAVDLEKEEITYYHNGKKVGEFQKVVDDAKLPYYPSVSFVGATLEFRILSSSFKYPLEGFKGIGDGLDLNKLEFSKYQHAYSPLSTTYLGKRGYITSFTNGAYRFVNDFEKYKTKDVIHIVNSMAKMMPHLVGDISDPDELREAVAMSLHSIKIQTMSEALRLYIQEKDERWVKEHKSDIPNLPILSSLRPRTQQETSIESTLKSCLLFLDSDNAPPPEDEDDEKFDFWGYAGEYFVQTQSLTSDDLIQTIYEYVNQDNNDKDNKAYDLCKFNMSDLNNWIKALSNTESMKCVATTHMLLVSLNLPGVEVTHEMHFEEIVSVVLKVLKSIEKERTLLHKYYIEKYGEEQISKDIDMLESDSGATIPFKYQLLEKYLMLSQLSEGIGPTKMILVAKELRSIIQKSTPATTTTTSSSTPVTQKKEQTNNSPVTPKPVTQAQPVAQPTARPQPTTTQPVRPQQPVSRPQPAKTQPPESQSAQDDSSSIYETMGYSVLGLALVAGLAYKAFSSMSK